MTPPHTPPVTTRAGPPACHALNHLHARRVLEIVPSVLPTADQIAVAFGLGQPLESVPVAGGLSNDMWRLQTDTGTFAVKVMRAHATNPDFRENIEAAYAVETNAHRRGVPCPEPVGSEDGRCLAEVAGELVRAHRWVDGKVVDGRRWLEQAGSLLAQVHGAADPFVAPLDDEPWDVEGWASLGDHADMPADLAQTLRDAAPTLARLESATAAPGLETMHVDSHGDLDPKNTLAVGDSLTAVDWDAAGVRVPADPWVLGGWVSALGGWLVHNATSRAHEAIGQQETRQTCERLVRLHRNLDRYLAALRSA
jgi:Ser/Thr protein kinase RdoA (MazF antagonist)